MTLRLLINVIFMLELNRLWTLFKLTVGCIKIYPYVKLFDIFKTDFVLTKKWPTDQREAIREGEYPQFINWWAASTAWFLTLWPHRFICRQLDDEKICLCRSEHFSYLCLFTWQNYVHKGQKVPGFGSLQKGKTIIYITIRIRNL